MWILPRAAYDLNDVIATTPLTAAQLAHVQIPATAASLLAMMFFGARHTDEHAREACPFIRFPKREVLLPRGNNAKGR